MNRRIASGASTVFQTAPPETREELSYEEALGQLRAADHVLRDATTVFNKSLICALYQVPPEQQTIEDADSLWTRLTHGSQHRYVALSAYTEAVSTGQEAADLPEEPEDDCYDETLESLQAVKRKYQAIQARYTPHMSYYGDDSLGTATVDLWRATVSFLDAAERRWDPSGGSLFDLREIQMHEEILRRSEIAQRGLHGDARRGTMARLVSLIDEVECWTEMEKNRGNGLDLMLGPRDHHAVRADVTEYLNLLWDKELPTRVGEDEEAYRDRIAGVEVLIMAKFAENYSEYLSSKYHSTLLSATEHEA